MNNPSFELNTEIVIHAGPEKVWDILTDFARYPEWNPFIRSITGELVVGKNINVDMHPPGGSAMKFSPKVIVVEKNKEFRWEGKVLIDGIFNGEHIFELKENTGGTTTFIHREQFKGILVPLLKNMLDTKTKAGFIAMNEKLKELAEK